MALALYRKYRPKTFAEVIGQEHVTEPLSQALRSGRLHHAYLFSGPRGCGKTSSARILARSLNCAKGPTPDPCGECESCRSLSNDGGGSIDVIEIDAASHGGVDDARELRERAFFAPVTSRYKIYVIDEAHMVSSAGYNALLKLVEEPPDYVKFVFATTEPEKVLGTIRSRTHHYPFRLIPPGVLRPYLEQLCVAEAVAVEPAVFPLVVRAGGGSARDSLSVLDQLIAGAGPDGISYARAVALLGVTDVALLDEMCDAMAAGDGAAAFTTVDRVAEAGHDPRRFAADLLERLRDLIVLQQVPDAVAKGLIDAPADQLERMSSQASRLGPATLSRCADIIHDGLVEMRGTTSPRLLLELISARMLLPAAEESTGALLQRVERMERRLAAVGGAAAAPTPADERKPAVPAPATPSDLPVMTPTVPTAAPTVPVADVGGPATSPASPAAPPPVTAQPPPAPTAGRGAGPSEGPSAGTAPAASREQAAGEPDVDRGGVVPAAVATGSGAGPAGGARSAGTAAGGLDAAALRRVWDEIVTTLGRRSKRAAAVVREATVRDVAGDTIVLLFRHAVHANMLAAAPQPLLAAVQEVIGGTWKLRCESADGGVVPPSRGPAPPRPPDRSGGAAGAASVPASGDTPDTDWPEPARPGGARATPVSPPATAATATAPAAPVDRRVRAAPLSRPVERPSRGAEPGAPGAVGGPRATAARETAVGSREVADEPPYDPELDGPVPAASWDGFAPGDGPTEEVLDERSAGLTPTQQALRLLQQALGAQKIGEVGA